MAAAFPIIERETASLHLVEAPAVVAQPMVLARQPGRPVADDYIRALCRDVVELRGDRTSGDDARILGRLGRTPLGTVVIIAHQAARHGRRTAHHDGAAGYGKALRLMRQAEKFNLPLLCILDAPWMIDGYGEAAALARCMHQMATLRVPIVAALINETRLPDGLGLGLADRVLSFEHAIVCVAEPDADAAERVLTAPMLLDAGIVDEIMPEPPGGAHHAPEVATEVLSTAVMRHLNQLRRLNPDDLREQRRMRWRDAHAWSELNVVLKNALT